MSIVPQDRDRCIPLSVWDADTQALLSVDAAWENPKKLVSVAPIAFTPTGGIAKSLLAIAIIIPNMFLSVGGAIAAEPSDRELIKQSQPDRREQGGQQRPASGDRVHPTPAPAPQPRPPAGNQTPLPDASRPDQRWKPNPERGTARHTLPAGRRSVAK